MKFDYTKKPPDKYIEGFIEYIYGCDTMPNLFDFLIHGYTMAEANRMGKLIRIESMKYHFEDSVEQYKPTEEEIADYKAYIARCILEYNYNKDMILLGEYEELAPEMGFPSMRDFISSEPYEHQNEVVHYLDSGHVHMVTATTFTDVFTGKRVGRELVYMDDGEYSWSSKLPYYVSEYNLRLPADFEARVLSTLSSKGDIS